MLCDLSDRYNSLSRDHVTRLCDVLEMNMLDMGFKMLVEALPVGVRLSRMADVPYKCKCRTVGAYFGDPIKAGNGIKLSVDLVIHLYTVAFGIIAQFTDALSNERYAFCLVSDNVITEDTDSLKADLRGDLDSRLALDP